jgi:hypothetical protein
MYPKEPLDSSKDPVTGEPKRVEMFSEQPNPYGKIKQPVNFQHQAKIIVQTYVNGVMDKSDEVHSITTDQIYVVWFAKALQNWKALVSTSLSDGMYYEVTYNGDESVFYLDAYKKFHNMRIPLDISGVV